MHFFGGASGAEISINDVLVKQKGRALIDLAGEFKSYGRHLRRCHFKDGGFSEVGERLELVGRGMVTLSFESQNSLDELHHLVEQANVLLDSVDIDQVYGDLLSMRIG